MYRCINLKHDELDSPILFSREDCFNYVWQHLPIEIKEEIMKKHLYDVVSDMRHIENNQYAWLLVHVMQQEEKQVREIQQLFDRKIKEFAEYMKTCKSRVEGSFARVVKSAVVKLWQKMKGILA